MLGETRDCNVSLRVSESSQEGWRDGGRVWMEELGFPCTPRKIWQGHQGFMKPRSASSQRSSVSPRNRLILVTLPCSNCDLSTNAELDFIGLGPRSGASSALCSWTSTTELCFQCVLCPFFVQRWFSVFLHPQAYLEPKICRGEEFRKRGTESLYLKPKLVTLVRLSIVSFLIDSSSYDLIPMVLLGIRNV